MKKIILLLVFLMLLSSFSVAVSAQEGDIFDKVLNFFRESEGLKYLTVDLASDFSSGNPSPAAQAIAKVLFIILFFAVLFGASSLAPGIKDFNKNIRISISFLLALIAGLAIPTGWLSAVVQTYSGLFILGLLLVPAVILLFANFKWVEGDDRGTQFVKAMFMAALLFIFQHVKNVVAGMNSGVLKFFAGLAEVIFGFLLIWYLIVGVILGKSEEAKEKIEDEESLLKKLLNLGKKKEPKTAEEKAEEEAEEKEKGKTVPPKKRKRRKNEFENRVLRYLENSIIFLRETHQLKEAGDLPAAKKRFGDAKRNITRAKNYGIGFLDKLLEDVNEPEIKNQLKALESELLRLSSLMAKTDIEKHPMFLERYKNTLAKYIASITGLMKKIKVY